MNSGLSGNLATSLSLILSNWSYHFGTLATRLFRLVFDSSKRHDIIY
jgi:hypothetical protein